MAMLINALATLDLTGVPFTAMSTALENVYREDEPRDSLSQDEALSGAPETENGYFKVPAPKVDME
jgi:aspartyl-tRNA(Asn)/glutamyl-tRNA(Gln) amidotransferase subunit C